MAEPADLATAQTLAFLARVLSPPPARLLEVGCGGGQLAAALQERGYAVTALDRDADAVEAARALGVPAIVAEFFEFSPAHHDAVLFTRSLHHIDDLPGAVDRAKAMLSPGGLVAVDEFARERADQATAAFFYDMRDVLAAADVLSPPEDGEDPGAARATSLERWEAEYGSRRHHALHTGASLLAALRARFAIEVVEECAYVYRHLGQWLERSERGLAAARELLEIERRRLARGELAPLGIMAAARRR